MGGTCLREIWGRIDMIQPLRSPTFCGAQPGNACGTSDFGIRVKGVVEAGTNAFREWDKMTSSTGSLD